MIEWNDNMVEKPLKKLKYQVVEEKRDNEAKVSELINPVLDKKSPILATY